MVSLRGSKPAEPAGPATKVNDYVYGTATMPKQKKEGGADFDGDVYALGKVEEGAKLFKAKCATCHSVTANGPTMQGPNLYGIMGRSAASSKGFKFTEKLKKAEVVWDNDTMFMWLTNPKAMVKGTTMAFAGFKKEEDRAHVIAYLNTIKAAE